MYYKIVAHIKQNLHSTTLVTLPKRFIALSASSKAFGKKSTTTNMKITQLEENICHHICLNWV